MGLASYSLRSSKSHFDTVNGMQTQFALPGFASVDAVTKRSSQRREWLAMESTGVKTKSSEKEVRTFNCLNRVQTQTFFTQSASRVKVLRELELGSSPLCAGRMRMSGRMADICAELERMASHAQS